MLFKNFYRKTVHILICSGDSAVIFMLCCLVLQSCCSLYILVGFVSIFLMSNTSIKQNARKNMKITFQISKQPKVVALKTGFFCLFVFHKFPPCMFPCGLRVILQQSHLGLLFNIQISIFNTTSIDSALTTTFFTLTTTKFLCHLHQSFNNNYFRICV